MRIAEAAAQPLVFENVTLAHRGRIVLSGADFTVNAGELACLVGSRCAGARMLLDLCAGEERPSSGEVRICGLPHEYWPPRELAARMRVFNAGASLFIGATVNESLHERCRISHGMSALLRRALRATHIERFAECDWRLLGDAERQRVQLAALLVEAWAVPREVRLVVVREGIATLPSPLAHIALAALRDFAAERNAGVLAMARDADLAAKHAHRVLVLHHEKESAPVMH